MKKIFGLIYNDMAEFETVFALNILGYHPSLEVALVAESRDPVLSKAGLTFVPDYSFNEAAKLADVEGLIIPGGWNDQQSPALTRLIQKLDAKEALLAAICRGPRFLACAGVLEGVKYTTTYSPEAAKAAGEEDPFDRENFVDEKVVVDGRFITAIGSAFVDFAVEIADYFDMFDDEEDREVFRLEHKGLG
ncbi:MAG: DJ-1/PfpI family protein [Spirochaetales bacterium]|uniref:DJ-1/PfpI family protein n=1 Tax=Candidatus Thalassospirochaeta sargassi TaxID=3119039 RepID=A0AAJ1IHP7_9SPIO|nr:DJ-1/PfpI family protein [Spirochaetales bacterium]